MIQRLNIHSEEFSHTDLQHESMWRVDKDGRVLPGRRLQAELSIRRLGVVGEGNGAGQLAVVQHLLVVLSQVDVALRLKLESALQGWTKEEEGVKGCAGQVLNERQMSRPRTAEMWKSVCVHKFNTQNGVCLIAP